MEDTTEKEDEINIRQLSKEQLISGVDVVLRQGCEMLLSSIASGHGGLTAQGTALITDDDHHSHTVVCSLLFTLDAKKYMEFRKAVDEFGLDLEDIPTN